LIEGIVLEGGVPAIKVEVGGQRLQAIIDTGFNGERAYLGVRPTLDVRR
jgi:predicted aspartyl protease